MHTRKVEAKKLLRAVFMITLMPVIFLIFYAATGRMSLDHALFSITASIVATYYFIYPYISNVMKLTDYVNDLAEDKTTSQPDLSFLSNLEELSKAVEHLNESWEKRKAQLEAALAENKIVLEVLPDALFILDEEQRILRTNGMARQMFGQKLAGKELSEVLPNESLVTTARHVKQAKEIEFNIDDGGIRRDYYAKITKFPANSPTSTDAILTLHDLTELKQIRKMRADFVANASHEMKTPLASIIGLIEIMQTTAKSDENAKQEFLRIMSEQSDRMKRLISDLLSLSKIEADTSAPETKADLIKVLPEARKHSEFAAKQKNVQVVMNLPKELPLIIGDEEQMAQVFINLISNAIKYGNADSKVVVDANVTRKLPVEMSEKFDKAIEVSVTDSSEGIPEEHIPRLTERFYRVDSARSRKLGGTGLGLAIVKHILNRHNAILKVHSEKGVGSTFSIFLPVAENSVLKAAEQQSKVAKEEI